ncbi:uncharacterized protein KRP23_700 [Phytophthora ramorum]|uniref:uncharacterized protein n=1 Tax=Phytophthora ramorum TaxID=164328 RepID=UPI003097E044|nr:hypothetical protein KRP23_700 [Phytophthora ramorum]
MPAQQEELDERFVQALRYQDEDQGQQNEGRRPLSRSASSAASRSTASFDREFDGEFDDAPMPYSDSAAIQSKKYMERDQVRLALEQEERSRRLNKIRARRQHLEKWTQKTSRSPFHVNLVADNERLDEEHRMRMMERTRRQRELERQLLRREKRAIIDEEKRLKALLDLEKTNSHRKMDLLAARNAEKRRRQEKEEYRRLQRQQELHEREATYKQLLKEKLALED